MGPSLGDICTLPLYFSATLVAALRDVHGAKPAARHQRGLVVCMPMGCNSISNVPFELVSPRMVGDSHLAREHLAGVAVASWRTQRDVCGLWDLSACWGPELHHQHSMHLQHPTAVCVGTVTALPCTCHCSVGSQRERERWRCSILPEMFRCVSQRGHPCPGLPLPTSGP